MDQVKIFKKIFIGCVPQILLCLFLNTLSNIPTKNAQDTIENENIQRNFLVRSKNILRTLSIIYDAGLLRMLLRIQNRYLFSQKTSSRVFLRVLNTPLNFLNEIIQASEIYRQPLFYTLQINFQRYIQNLVKLCLRWSVLHKQLTTKSR